MESKLFPTDAVHIFNPYPINRFGAYVALLNKWTYDLNVSYWRFLNSRRLVKMLAKIQKWTINLVLNAWSKLTKTLRN